MPPSPETRFDVRLLSSISEVGRHHWDRLYAGRCENYDYFLACELAVTPAFEYSAITVFHDDRMVAGTPVFRTTLSLEALTEGLLKKTISLVQKPLPHLSRVRVMGVGSPHVDELPLVFDTSLNTRQRQEVIKRISRFVQAQLDSKNADVVLWKNLDAAQREEFGNTLCASRYAPISGLPVAFLEVLPTEESYIQGLSANMRSNIRRKLKRAADIEVEIRRDTGALDEQLFELREQTRKRAPTDYDIFEEISPDYIASVLRQNPTNSRLLLYRHEGRLLGFALVLMEPTQLKEKYTGMRYPEALNHGIFFLNWMTVIRLCQQEQIPQFRAGETTYLTKARLGCEFERSWLYVKHRQPLVNLFLKHFSRWFDLDRNDPDLRLLATNAPYREA